MAPYGRRTRFLGIDFSGAKDAGKHIAIATATIEDGALRVEDCKLGESLVGSGRRLEPCLGALVDLIEGERSAGIGLDFPFGIPRELVEESSWEDFVVGFAAQYQTPEEFRASWRQACETEPRRHTDNECHTPMSPYNLRLYKQTFYGIRDVLRPLAAAGKARVLPMQKPEPGLPWLVEVCPASTLRLRNLPTRYKKRTAQHRKARQNILESLQTEMDIPYELIDAALEDHKGDVIDSIIAAQVTARALTSASDPLRNEVDYMLEGRVHL